MARAPSGSDAPLLRFSACRASRSTFGLGCDERVNDFLTRQTKVYSRPLAHFFSARFRFWIGKRPRPIVKAAVGRVQSGTARRVTFTHPARWPPPLSLSPPPPAWRPPPPPPRASAPSRALFAPLAGPPSWRGLKSLASPRTASGRSCARRRSRARSPGACLRSSRIRTPLARGSPGVRAARRRRTRMFPRTSPGELYPSEGSFF